MLSLVAALIAERLGRRSWLGASVIVLLLRAMLAFPVLPMLVVLEFA